MMNGFGFKGRMSKEAYFLFTMALVAVVYGLAAIEPGASPLRFINEPWTILGHALDRWIQIGGPGASAADTVVSFMVGGTLMWMIAVVNVRRLRDIGQSPWWALLLVVSGMMIPVMILLSFVPSNLKLLPTGTARPSSAGR